MKWEEVRKDFPFDEFLWDLYVFNVSVADLDAFLKALDKWGYRVSFSEDGVERAKPTSFQAVYSRSSLCSTLLKIEVGRLQFNWHFFADDELELDFEPSQLTGQNDLDDLLTFVERIGRLLGKDALVCPENSPDRPILRFDFRANCTLRVPA
jgi:hypothetical protein